MHPTKRKRTDNAASTLIKPFRSPVRVDVHNAKPLPEKQNDQISQDSDSSALKRLQGVSQTISNSSANIPATSATWVRSRQAQSSPTRPLPSRGPMHDEEYLALQKQHSALALKLKHLSSSLDVSNQATRIARSNKKQELERLVAKWRAASQDAAEDLFSTAKDRVNRMGGVGAWRERYMNPHEGNSWNQEPEIDQDELTEEQKEQLEIATEEARIESEKYGLQQHGPTLNVQDDDAFTIDMMLKQLNVDLELIGFNAQSQQWMH